MATTTQPTRRRMRGRQPVLSRIGTWLRTTLRKERSADPLWEEDERRRRSGKMGENVVTDEAAPPGDGVTRKVQD